MKITSAHITLIFVTLFFQSINAQDLTSPPDGFEWAYAEEIKGAFLKPKDWHFKKHKEKNAQSYYISKENIDKEGSYLTGLSVLVIKNLPELMKITTSQFGDAYITKAIRNKKIIKQPWRYNQGELESWGVVMQNKDPLGGDYNTHNLVVGNSKTGTVYTIVYEAPTENWDISWEIGEVILSKLMFNPDV